MDFSNLEYSYNFKAKPTELKTVGEVSDVIEWIEFELIAKTTYEGQEYEGISDGIFNLNAIDDYQESYESDEKDLYESFASKAVPLKDVNSAKIMQWLNWNSPMVESIRDIAIDQIHEAIKETIKQAKGEDTITFLD